MRALNQTSEPGIPAEQETQPIVEVWLWNELIGRQGRKLVLVLVGAIALGTLVAGAILGGRVWRIATVEDALKEAGADYAWLYQTLDTSRHEPPRWSQEDWAERLGNPFASDISLVKIRDGNLDDRQLSFLENLREVRSFELRSNFATDKTLDTVSKLPNLRYLTIIGDQFSVMGLLKLRASPHLAQLRLNSQQYTAIELAVLKAELAGVDLFDIDTASNEPYRSLAQDFDPAVSLNYL